MLSHDPRVYNAHPYTAKKYKISGQTPGTARLQVALGWTPETCICGCGLPVGATLCSLPSELSKLDIMLVERSVVQRVHVLYALMSSHAIFDMQGQVDRPCHPLLPIWRPSTRFDHWPRASAEDKRYIVLRREGTTCTETSVTNL